jgi:hypothetical protein
MGARMLTTWVRGLFSPKASEDADLEYEKYFVRFQQILEVEQGAIDARRSALGRPVPPWPPIDHAKRGGAQRPMYDSTGLALSGGGIRSAAFCLGALQSLAVTGATGAAPVTRSLFDQVDYLSTVSGGGYVGSAVTAAMASPTTTSQKFPFAEFGRFDDKPSVGHLRDFSNYLFPRGSSSLADVISVVLRGLATNVVFILAGIFFFATLTLIAYPDAVALNGHGSFPLVFLGAVFPHWAEALKSSPAFALTIVFLAIFAIYLVVWALLRSRPAMDFGAVTDGLFSDVRGVFIRGGRLLVFAVAVAAFLDVQPFALSAFNDFVGDASQRGLLEAFTAFTAPFAGIVAFFGNRLSQFLKANSFETGAAALVKRITAQALILAAAAVLPILLWFSYLAVTDAGVVGSHVHWPECVQTTCRLWHYFPAHHAYTYAILWALFFLPTLLFAPNANSLHQLYRDKLSKAFLFNPTNRSTQGQDRGDLLPRDQIELSELAPATGGPYHLINAAINLQGSVQANRRGRNASFFLFSPKFVGSEVTDFAPSELVQKADWHIDLGAAMAISGAAVSSNMGSSSVRALSPTLALLNIRLGYWMRNPKFLICEQRARLTLGRLFADLFKTYLFNEMFGQLDENQPHVYLTDGGHIENLGLYSLLKRHCRLIVVVDGEADPQLTFHALSTCERYARIDLGVRLDVPWQQIADVGKAATALAEEGKPIPPTGGPHCTVGSILYPGGERGVLLYVKASLTGDEPDYVVDYKMRYPAFPHESTGDQFFSEEQFEAYRALGFHALDGFLSGKRALVSSKDVETAAQLARLSVPDFVRSLMV